MYITWQTIITAGSVIGVAAVLIKYFTKSIRWIDKQEKQDCEIKSIKDEQTLITYGVLCCLKGLAEQGCDGPVHEAIDKIEKHLNVQAHK